MHADIISKFDWRNTCEKTANFNAHLHEIFQQSYHFFIDHIHWTLYSEYFKSKFN